ncbi:unnamed protein product [Rotaria magnacalcarata]|uniref:Uncharacterized protein n=1 Tax=Rotaria magnacalcarata TaxID=392030 RepID=A0A816M9J1_9BILA|nr:unnamed protein product [Rotaria magnacalcarata]
MYSMIFKDTVLEIDDDDAKSINTLVIYCRQQKIPEIQINSLQSTYHQKSPVWWYSKSMFLRSMLNRALRLLDMETMIKTVGKFSTSVYRGQGLSQQDFQNLCDSKGGLLSFNNFLSTSKEKEEAMNFVQDSPHESADNVSVIFIMTIDQSKLSTSNTPFALIDEHSAIPSEQEILFTMHKVQLTITDDDDPQLFTLTSHIKQEVRGSIGWYRMGQLMLKVGHFNQAEELNQELLKNASADSDRANIYRQLGWLKDQQGKYQEAANIYEISLEVERNTLPEDYASLATTYGNIGRMYDNMGEYSKALEF